MVKDPDMFINYLFNCNHNLSLTLTKVLVLPKLNHRPRSGCEP